MKSNWPVYRLAVLLLASLAFLASPANAQTGSPPAAASAAAATLIKHIDVRRAGELTNVRVEGNGHLSYQALRLSNPERLVLDFSGVNVAASKNIPSETEPVRSVRLGQVKPDVARVVIDLEGKVPYSVKDEGQSVTVVFTPAPHPVAELSTQGNTESPSTAPAAPQPVPAQNAVAPAPEQQAKDSADASSVNPSDAPLKAQVSARDSEVKLTDSASTTAAAATLSAIVPDEYLINPDDVLDVYVFDVPELSREYTVSATGTVTVPLLPQPVRAAGLSPDQFAHALEQSFRQAGTLSRPQITVAIKQSLRSVVAVDGAVKSPQNLPVIERTKLVDVLTRCGGLDVDHGSTVTVTRGALAQRDLALEREPVTRTVTVELKQLMDGSDPMSQFVIWPGDRVSVERAGIFYVLGAVGHPGGFNLRSAEEQVTVLQALAIAGDVTLVAKKSKAFIIRKNSTVPSGRDEIALDIPHILAGHSKDPVLRSNDILYVPASGAKRAVNTLAGVPATLIAAATYSRF